MEDILEMLPDNTASITPVAGMNYVSEVRTHFYLLTNLMKWVKTSWTDKLIRTNCQ